MSRAPADPHPTADERARTESDAAYEGALSFVGAGVGVRLVSQAVGLVAGFAVIAVSLRLLGTAAYGRLAFALSVVAMVTAIGRLGLGLGTAHTVAAAAGDAAVLARAVRGALTLGLLTGAVSGLAVVGLVVVLPLGAGLGTKVVVGSGLGLLLFGNNVSWAVYSIARGLGRLVVMEAVHHAVTVGQIVAVAVLAIIGVADIRAVAAGFGAAGIAGAVVAAAVAARLLPEVERLFRPALDHARTLLRFLVPVALAGIALRVISQFDVFVLGLFSEPREVGVYQPTLNLVDAMMQLVPFLVTGAYVPAATRLFARGDRRSFAALYVTSTKLGYVVAFPAVLAAGAFPEASLRAVYGSGFPVRPSIAWILLAGYVVNVALGLNVVSLLSAGQRGLMAVVNVAGFATMVVFAFALVPSFGQVGAAVATTVSYLAWNLAASTALYRSTGVHPLRPDVALTVLTSAVPLAAALAVREWARPGSAFEVVAWSLGLWAAWVGLLVAARILRRAELSPLTWKAGRGGGRRFLQEDAARRSDVPAAPGGAAEAAPTPAEDAVTPT